MQQTKQRSALILVQLAFLLVLTTIFPVVHRAYSAPPSNHYSDLYLQAVNSCYTVEEELRQCLINGCSLYNTTVQIAAAKLRAFLELDGVCKAHSELRPKSQHTKVLLSYFDFFADNPDFGFSVNVTELCGGAFNDEYIKVLMEPEELSLDVGERAPIKASVKHRSCQGAEKYGCGCKENSDCGAGGSCIENTIKARLEWGVQQDTEIISLQQTAKDSVEISAKYRGLANVTALAVDAESIGLDPLIGITHVSVGKQNADIVFVVDTTMEHWCNFPGDGCDWTGLRLPDHASVFYERLKEQYVDGFRLGVISYSDHPSFCTDINFCDIPSADCYTSRLHGEWGYMSKVDFVSAFGSLRTVCANSAYYYCPAGDGCYYGTSMYSGLMRAINDFYWRDDAVKAIILIGGNPACFYYYPDSYCNVEPVTGISRAEVISSASAKGIKIFAINTIARKECYSGTHFQAISARTELSTLASVTGGIYYPSSFLVTECSYPPDYDNILTALWDVRNLTGGR
jgi:hypothetical protein